MSPAAPGALVLAGELTIQTAALTRTLLLDALTDALLAGAPVALDLGRVEELDTAGLQLLLALRRDADAADVPVVLVAASSAVADVLALVGLDDLRPAPEGLEAVPA